MHKFKTASRTPDELQSAKDELDAIFSIVKDTDRQGRLNPRAVQELDDNRYELAELILEIVNDELLLSDPAPFLVDQRDGVFGDKYVFQELDSALRVVARSYGTKPLSQRLWFKEYELVTSMKEVAVEVPLEEVAIGRITPSLVAEQMALAITRDRVNLILTAIDNGVSSGADRTGLAGYTLRYTTFDQPNLDRAIDGMLDEDEAPVILSRHIAMAPSIRGFTGWSDDITEEFQRRGVIGTYHGANIISLRDKFLKTTGEHIVPNNRIYLSSTGRKGAIYQSKDVGFLDWAMVDPRSSTFGVGTRVEDGVLVHDPFLYRIIEV